MPLDNRQSGEDIKVQAEPIHISPKRSLSTWPHLNVLITLEEATSMAERLCVLKMADHWKKKNRKNTD